MLKRSCRTFVVALSASAFLAPLAPALAGPTHALGSIRPPEFGGARVEPGTQARPSLLVEPLQVRPLAVTRPVNPAPAFAPFVPVRANPAYWPQLRFASMFAVGSSWFQCSMPRSSLFTSAYLPATGSPFAAPACGQDPSAVGDADGITTLMPGHDKDALYGPAYSPRDFGTP